MDELTGNKNQNVGSVLVVGSGISGMQAAIDLAGAGYKVLLIEKKIISCTMVLLKR